MDVYFCFVLLSTAVIMWEELLWANSEVDIMFDLIAAPYRWVTVWVLNR